MHTNREASCAERLMNWEGGREMPGGERRGVVETGAAEMAVVSHVLR